MTTAAEERAATGVDLADILGTEEVPAEQWVDLRRKIHCSIELREELEGLLESFGPVSRRLSSDNKVETRKAVGLWLLGRTRESLEKLAAVRISRESAVISLLGCLEAGLLTRAAEFIPRARELEGDTPLVMGAVAEWHIKSGRAEEGRAAIDRLPKKADERPDVHYLRGLACDFLGETAEALEHYQKALDLEPTHAPALFRTAFLYDLHGDDERAFEIYENLRAQRPVHIHTLLNLGLHHEDRGDYRKAIACYQAVLDADPRHPRARLYLGDAKASLNMYYDEEMARKEQKLGQLLATPLAEFQISVRARNCLDKLAITTLGELVAKTEEELLETPNFGHASLKEVKELLASRGLHLSTSKNMPVLARDLVRQQAAAEKEGILAKPVAEFEWSERIRKAFEKLKIRTLGEVATKTEQEFLNCENFGQTSLKELKKKLVSLGMALKAE
jgi:DNA-directed RNA polymerase subunit alpha